MLIVCFYIFQVQTLDAPDAAQAASDGGGAGGLGSSGSGGSILTRRLGLIVGSCMGFIVFVVLVSALGYLKLKKQRQAAKRDAAAAPLPHEYLSYRHFSIQSGEAAAAAAEAVS